MGKFMSAQVVADMKHVAPFITAPDWWAFAEPGPGSLRGMRRLFGLEAKDTKYDKSWKNNLFHLRDSVNEELSFLDYPELDAQNVQNCLCEFDKYMRCKLGEGKPKQLYRKGENK
jgi:hypothetical protein